MNGSTVFLMVFIAICGLVSLKALWDIYHNNRNAIVRKAKLVQLREQPASKSDKFDAPKILTHETWANFEGAIPGLFEVIVLAHKVQEPTSSLLSAVRANFRRGVHYLFIVSASREPAEVTRYYGLFQEYAKIEIAEKKLTYTLEELVTIGQLNFEWTNVPLVFYRFRDSMNHTKVNTIAFRGDTENEGIADSYIAIDYDTAEALMKLLLSPRPAPLKDRNPSSEEDYVQPRNIVENLQFNDTLPKISRL